MEYQVLIKKFSDIVEEEIQVEVEGINIVCFSNFHNPNMTEGKIYTAILELCILDDISLIEIDKPIKHFNRIDDTFEYKINGKLENGILDAGIKFKIDQEHLYDYWNLDGKYVEISGIDRINIDFDI